MRYTPCDRARCITLLLTLLTVRVCTTRTVNNIFVVVIHRACARWISPCLRIRAYQLYRSSNFNDRWYIQVNSGVAKSSTSFGWGKGGKVTSARWQVTLCDLIWHVISRGGVVISITNCYIRFTFTLLLHTRCGRTWYQTSRIDEACTA